MELSDLDVAESVLDLVGGTPLVRLSRIGAHLLCPVLVKLETTNPGGSIKDRAAIAMVDAAERVPHRSGRKHSRRSATSKSGCSSAAKCPPRGMSVQ